MKKDWFEKGLNDKLEGFESELDLNEAWESFSVQRKKQKKKKRGFVFWWFAAAILTLCIVFSLLFTKENASLTPTNQPQAKHITSQEKALTKNNIAKETNEQIAEATPEKIIRKTLKEPKISNRNKPVNLINVNNEKRITKASANDTPTLFIDKTQPSQNVIVANKEVLPTLSSSIKMLEERKIDAQYQSIALNKETNENELKNSAGLAFYYGQNFRQRTANNNQNYIARRNVTETPLDAFALQAFYKRKLNSKFFVNAQIGYSQITDVLMYDYEDTSFRSFDDQVLSISYYPNGLQTESTGSALGTQTVSTRATYYQSYKSIDLGFAIGMKQAIFGKFSLRPSIGLAHNWQYRTKGLVLKNETTFETYALDNLNYRKIGLLGAFLNLELVRKIHTDYEISLGISAQQGLNNRFSNSDLIEKRSLLLGRIAVAKQF